MSASSYMTKLMCHKQKSKKKYKIELERSFKMFNLMGVVVMVQVKEDHMAKDEKKKQKVEGRLINVAIDRDLYLKLLEVKQKTGRTIRHQISELIRNA